MKLHHFGMACRGCAFASLTRLGRKGSKDRVEPSFSGIPWRLSMGGELIVLTRIASCNACMMHCIKLSDGKDVQTALLMCWLVRKVAVCAAPFPFAPHTGHNLL